MTVANPTSPPPGGVPAAPVPPAPPPPVAPPHAPAPGHEHQAMSHEAFNARLAQERAAGERATLAALGTESVDAAKARIAKAAELERAGLTEQEKAAARIKELEPVASKAAAMEAALKETLEAQEKAIPEDKRGHLELAPTDPVERLKWITKAHAKGLFSGVPAAPTAPQTPAANTRAGNGPPPPALPPGQKHPRDMSPQEFREYQAKKNAEYRNKTPR